MTFEPRLIVAQSAERRRQKPIDFRGKNGCAP
jgi:hypothetical protein